MLNEFKERKHIEFQGKFCKVFPNGSSRFLRSVHEKSDVEIWQFISDLIDEMESNAFLKDIVTKTVVDTLKQVLPKGEGDREYDCGYACRVWLLDKAKEIWGIDLTN